MLLTARPVHAEEAGSPSVHVVGELRLAISEAGAVQSLGPANQTNFSFTTTAFGELTIRSRASVAGAWGPTQIVAAGGGTPLAELPPGALAASRQSLAGGRLVVEQRWAAAADAAGGLLLSYALHNNGSAPLEIGGLAVSMPSNEQTGGDLAMLAATASFADPYIGGGHGHLTMTRLTGRGGVLMVLGEGATAMEAFSDQWSPLGKSCNAWAVHSAAFADVEWPDADGRWVNATSATIPAGGSFTRAFRILLAAGGVRQKSAALRAAGRPVLVAVPGYVVATDMASARLFVQPPAQASLTSAYVVNDSGNGDGARPAPCMAVGAAALPNAKGWVALPLTPTQGHCRCRVELRYSDGSYQVASYYVLPALDAHLATFGGFQASAAFYDDDTDPFGLHGKERLRAIRVKTAPE
jgi:hypothetical protein